VFTKNKYAMPNYNSYYKSHANKKLNWLPMDTYELYQQNLVNRYDELKRNDWINNPFTYDFNSLGFRCNEFTSDTSIMFLGCSHTIGIGLPQEVIWPELVSTQLNVNCINLGIGGSSCDTAFRLCHGYINKIKPKVVIFMIPPGTRSEVVTNNSIANKLVSSENHREYVQRWAIDDNNNYFNREKNILGIRMLCQEHNAKFISAETSELSCSESLARDLAHPGKESHRLFAEKILNQI
jgi:hypothetical protein